MSALAPIPVDEPARMSAVQRYEILDTPPDGSYDRITAIAARRFNVPIAIISVVDHDRIWFKSRHGVDATQINRDPGLCASAIMADGPSVVSDAPSDPRTLANPLVAGGFGLRFYAGIPLKSSDGYNLGTLCVIDREPRKVTDDEIADLKDLASLVTDQLELRLSAKKAIAQASILSREIDHRVMNSLQFVTSMLRMQSKSSINQETMESLRDAANRVSAVARIHHHFQDGDPSERIGCLSYIRRLCEDLSGILEVKVSVAGVDAHVSSQQIQPIGLIVTELVTNAAKHGGGKISVDFRTMLRGDHVLSVSNEGESLPEGFDPFTASTGLGMKLVKVLAAQLKGAPAAGANPAGPGAKFAVAFPAV